MVKGKFKSILVGVDDSEDALLAFDYAIHYAMDLNAQLTITSILENKDMNIYQSLNKDYIHGERKELEKHLLDYKHQASNAGVNDVNLIVGEGNPGETIVKSIIPHIKPDLLIIGSIAKKGIKRYFGSQAAYMAKYSPISVLVVR